MAKKAKEMMEDKTDATKRDKQLDFTSKQGQQIAKAIELLSNAGVIVWKKLHPSERERVPSAILGAELDLRIFVTGEGEVSIDNTGDWSFTVYSEDGRDSAIFPFGDDVTIEQFSTSVEDWPTLDRPSQRVLVNAEMARIAWELYPEIMAKHDAK